MRALKYWISQGLMVLGFCGAGGLAHSTEPTWFLPSADGSIEFLTAYREDTLWIINRFRVEPGQLQERLWQKSFDQKNQWQKTLNSYLLSESWQKNQQHTLSMAFTQTEDNHEVLWPATEQWNQAWERAYAHWVQNEVGPDFFVRYNIKTDCADVAFSLRWIFARIHGLPAANRLAGSRVLFNNESMRRAWGHLPTNDNWWEDQRFLAGLNYLLDNTYTHTLLEDSYPVEVSHRNFLAGGIHLNIFDGTGHTYFIHRVFTEGDRLPVQVMSSTVPRKVRHLREEGYWVTEQPSLGRGGLLRSRWPTKTPDGHWSLTSPQLMPWYSEEQYQSEFMIQDRYFYQAVSRRLNPETSVEAEFRAKIANLIARIEARVEVVEQGYRVCLVENCEPGSENWEIWSTPARDQAIIDLFEQIEDQIYKNWKDHPELLTIWRSILVHQTFYMAEQRVNLDLLAPIFKGRKFTSDPRDIVDKRWGLLMIIR